MATYIGIGKTPNTRTWQILKVLEGEMSRSEIAKALGLEQKFIESSLATLYQSGKIDRRNYEGLLYFRNKNAPTTDLKTRIKIEVAEWRCTECLTSQYKRSGKRTICENCRRIESRGKSTTDQGVWDIKLGCRWLRKAITKLNINRGK